MGKEDRVINFRLNNEMYKSLCKEAEERNVGLSELCRIAVQSLLNRGVYIKEPDEATFVNKMYTRNVGKQSLPVKRMGEIRRHFIELWREGLDCVIDIDISTIPTAPSYNKPTF
jgi:hypothetical protein